MGTHYENGQNLLLRDFKTMSRSIRYLHRHGADGGLVGTSPHVVANHIVPRGWPGGVKTAATLCQGDTGGYSPLRGEWWFTVFSNGSGALRL